MNVSFVVEGSHAKGMGDVYGMIPVAEELRRMGGAPRFLALGRRSVPALLSGRGLEAEHLPSLDRVVERLAGLPPGVAVFNRQNTAPRLLERTRQAGHRVVTVDDVGPGAARADLRLNPLYRIPHSLGGPELVPLRPEFRRTGRGRGPEPERCCQVLLTLGGADTHGFMPLVIRALDGLLDRATATLVLGPCFRDREGTARLARRAFPDLRLLENAADMAGLMAEADLAVSAGGMTMFELCCTGVPTVVVCGEPFEEESAELLAGRGAVVNLGFGSRLDAATIREAVARLLDDPVARQDLSRRGRHAVDGKGAARMAGHIRDLVRGGRS